MLVFVAEDVLSADDSLLQTAVQFLPRARLAYSRKYKKREDQALCIYSYLLLRHAMREGYHIRRLPAFHYNKYGKPAFAGFPIKFSISHCKKGVCCAVSTHEVGVDIQNTEDHRVMKHIMTDSEQLFIANSESPDETFTRLWAMKESYFKMLGLGLCEQMKKTDFSSYQKTTNYYNGSLIYTFHGKGYHLSVSSKAIEQVDMVFVDINNTKLYA
jgi:4'-phosphopantetheinyl transferase